MPNSTKVRANFVQRRHPRTGMPGACCLDMAFTFRDITSLKGARVLRGLCFPIGCEGKSGHPTAAARSQCFVERAAWTWPLILKHRSKTRAVSRDCDFPLDATANLAIPRLLVETGLSSTVLPGHGAVIFENASRLPSCVRDCLCPTIRPLRPETKNSLAPC